MAGLLLLLLAATSYAKGPQGIRWGRHNLASAAETPGNPLTTLSSTDEDEICIFCHTPHGGTLDGPLWNRTMPGSTSFTHYDSATLSPTIGDRRAIDGGKVYDESLLCLSCHDGTIAMNDLHNVGNDIGAPGSGATDKILPGLGFMPNYLYIGKDLSDDHPVSFNYQAAQEHASNAGDLHSIADAEAAGVRFFPHDGADAEKRLECSSCHDPHVNYKIYGINGGHPLSEDGDPRYEPFLVTPNEGSALCLACHDK